MCGCAGRYNEASNRSVAAQYRISLRLRARRIIQAHLRRRHMRCVQCHGSKCLFEKCQRDLDKLADLIKTSPALGRYRQGGVGSWVRSIRRSAHWMAQRYGGICRGGQNRSRNRLAGTMRGTFAEASSQNHILRVKNRTPSKCARMDACASEPMSATPSVHPPQAPLPHPNTRLYNSPPRPSLLHIHLPPQAPLSRALRACGASLRLLQLGCGA
jgi:hypothetical protein